MQTVVLDALIPREDFEIVSDIGNGGNTRNKTTLSIEDLKYDSFFFAALRKPIFQRETDEEKNSGHCMYYGRHCGVLFLEKNLAISG